MLPAACGVLPGDVAVSVSPFPPGAAPRGPGDEGEGGKGGPRWLETVVTSVHFWRSEEDEEDRQPTADIGVALAMGGGGGVDQSRCVSALAAPSFAPDAASLAARELSLAGRKASAAAAAGGEVAGERRPLGDVAALAERMSAVEPGSLAVRNAPSGARVMDLASSMRRGRANARGAAWLDPARGAAGGGGGGGVASFGDDSSFLTGPAPTLIGMSPALAFGLQAGGIVVLGVILLLAQRVRASRGRDVAVRRKAAGGGGAGLPAPPVGSGGRTFGADEERGVGIGARLGTSSGGANDKGRRDA